MKEHDLTSDNAHIVASADALSLPNRRLVRNVDLRGRMPGAVIFIHGVNDTGGTYETVEKGLCQGLNERLGRTDLAPGEYGVRFREVDKRVSEGELNASERHIFRNPDAYLYARTEASTTHSPFIPFYWGYRADEGSIEKVKSTGAPTEVRGQFQHVAGHRLDRDFAKEGGHFPNATNNIPAMFGHGFVSGALPDIATKLTLGGKSVFIAKGPDRSYFVLAAHRLAMLIRTMRSVQSDDPSKDASRDTVTIIGHSQGTLIALLAQALLSQDGQRCADCLILVDSPYSLHEEVPSSSTETPEVQTSYAKIQTLIDIVNAVTAEPFELPKLADLLVDASEHEGRTGRRWQATCGERPAKDGHGLIQFTERDNRGKVYCYFCPEDTVVAMKSVQGIGTFGVPDTVTETWHEDAHRTSDTYAPKHSRTLPAMDALRTINFFQRMWTRLPRKDARGQSYHPPVGLPPGYVAARDDTQHASAGPAGGITGAVKHMLLDAAHSPGDVFFINGEALDPPYVPAMYGGEIETGGPDEDGKDHLGKMTPDRVTMDVSLGNRYAKFLLIPVLTHGDPSVRPDPERFKAGFNELKDSDDQTARIVVQSYKPRPSRTCYRLLREETPREARDRMAVDPQERSENNYHSAILNHTENHRWVTAMDVAIGQSVGLDDPVWRSLFLLMAQWRYSDTTYSELLTNPNFCRLDDKTTLLVSATRNYFKRGILPGEEIMPMTPPPLISKYHVVGRSNKRPRDLPDIRVPEQTLLTAHTEAIR